MVVVGSGFALVLGFTLGSGLADVLDDGTAFVELSTLALGFGFTVVVGFGLVVVGSGFALVLDFTLGSGSALVVGSSLALGSGSALVVGSGDGSGSGSGVSRSSMMLNGGTATSPVEESACGSS